MKNARFFVLSLFAIFLLSYVSAVVTCDSNIIQKTWTQGASTGTSTVTCTNQGLSTISATLYGSYVSSNPSFPLTINPNVSKIMTLSYDDSAPQGSYPAIITFNDASPAVVINMTVTQGNNCQINPSLVSYSQAIQQGTKFALPKVTFNPINCNGALVLTASSVSIQGGIITTDGQKPVYIQSVVSDGINLNVDTTSLNTQQTYSSTLTVTAYGKQFQIPLSVTVTAGSNPVTNFSIENLPVCSVTNTVLNLNATYSLVCTNIQPDVTITPEVDSDFILGTGLETSGTQYIWYFKPIKFGNTVVKAKFYYRGATVGKPFSQDVRITSSGSIIPGTTLSFLFTPNLETASANQDVIVQLIDNRSSSLVNQPELYVNALAVNTSQDGASFIMRFRPDVDYTMRGRANGYDDLVQIVRLLSKAMNLTISPSSGDSQTTFNISTDVNASLFIDGVKVVNPYLGLVTEGSHEIKGIAQGYFDNVINFTVKPALLAQNLNQEFQKGVTNTFTLSENTSWKVTYKSDASSTTEEQIVAGNGDRVEFKPSSTGFYQIKTLDGKVLGSYEIKGWDGKILTISWIYWLIGIAVLAFIGYYLVKSKANSASNEIVGFGGMVNHG